jgi:hypothetical protein
VIYLEKLNCHLNANTLDLGPIPFFGGNPSEPIPSLEGLASAKRTKGDVTGKKAERPICPVVLKGKFREIDIVEEHRFELFGV